MEEISATDLWDRRVAEFSVVKMLVARKKAWAEYGHEGPGDEISVEVTADDTKGPEPYLHDSVEPFGGRPSPV